MGSIWSLRFAFVAGVVLISGAAAGEAGRHARVEVASEIWAFAISPDGSALAGFGREGVPAPASWRSGQLRLLGQELVPPITRGAAHGASRRGRVVVGGGAVEGGLYRPARWHMGRTSFLSPLEGEALDVSRSGRISIGYVRDAGGHSPMRWVDTRSVPVPQLPGAAHVELERISGNGRAILGVVRFGDDSLKRVLWRRDEPIVIESLPDGELSDLHRSGLSDDGTTVVGDDSVDVVEICRPGVCFEQPIFRAWRWRDGRIEDLGSLAPDPIEVHAFGASGNGHVVVGNTWESGADQLVAYLWDRAHGMRSLQQLLEELGAELGGLTLLYAFDVSADGRHIMGRAALPSGLEVHYRASLPPACADHIDNDGDGRVDFPEDPGCRHRSARRESR